MSAPSAVRTKAAAHRNPRPARDADRTQAAILDAATGEFARTAWAARASTASPSAPASTSACSTTTSAARRPVPGGARARLRAHPRRGAQLTCRDVDTGRGDPPAGRLHLELLHRAPGVPDAAEQREPAPRAAPEAVPRDPGDALAAGRDARRPARARRAAPACSGRASTRCSSTSRSPRSSYFYLANHHTLSTIFGRDLLAPRERAERLAT